MADHPSWLLTLVAAVEQYEDCHGHPNEGWECMAGAFQDVPDDVRAEARGYARARREAAEAQRLAQDVLPLGGAS